jgi:glycerophosphoryl diester phosphodiesterase
MKNVLLLLFVIALCHNANAQQVEFSSHRGSSTHAPENTIASVLLAQEQNTDAIEIDVHLSKDNRLMVIHDKDTKRTSGKDYVVKETDSETLRRLDVGSFKGAEYKGEKIPFLEEIIEILDPSVTLYIELKCGLEALPVLEKTINASPNKDQLAIICFDLEVITAVKKMLPDNTCHLLLGKPDGLKENIKLASENGIDAIDMRYSLITQEVVDYVHSLDMKINAWTVDDPREAERLMALNVDGIESNCVPCLKEGMNI